MKLLGSLYSRHVLVVVHAGGIELGRVLHLSLPFSCRYARVGRQLSGQLHTQHVRGNLGAWQARRCRGQQI